MLPVQETNGNGSKTTKSSSDQEHPSVAKIELDDGDLGDEQHDAAVGHGLGVQETEVGFVVIRSECVIDSGGHYGVHPREDCVQQNHQETVAQLGGYCLFSCN